MKLPNKINPTRSRTCLLFLSFCMLLISCSKKESAQESEPSTKEDSSDIVSLTDAQIETAQIELGRVEQRQLSGSIKVNGLLDVPPQSMVNVSVPLGGFLKSTHLLQGTRVVKGERIATVENLEFIQVQQDYLDARNQLELAQTEYNRQQELAKENANAQKTLQQAKSGFVSWSIKSNALAEKLRLLNINPETIVPEKVSSVISIYAPISGYVTAINLNIGKFANPTDVLFTIVDTDHLHAELTVFEKDLQNVKVGQKIKFTLVNESKERVATVHLIGREIATDRTVRIHGHLDKEDKNLLPGMFLKGVVESGSAQVNALPNEAIVDFANKKYIFFFNAKTDQGANYRFVEIKTGKTEMNFTEVMLEASNTDWQVVTKGAYALLSKLKNTEE